MSAVETAIMAPVTEAEATAESRAEAEDAIALLRDMVSIRSESGAEQELAGFLVRRMYELGLDAHVDEAGNAVGQVGRGSRHLVLLGHMDTVPGGPAPEIRDGCLYGRGAVDAKGPLATFVSAVSRLARDPDFEALDLRLTVVGAVEEEVSSSKGARFVAGTMAPDACIIGEPSSSGAVTLGYKGRLLVDVERSCPTTHSAGPEPTAAARVVEDWNRIQALAQESNIGASGIFALLQTELQQIRSERQGDEERCRATFGFRLPPSWSPEALAARVRELVPEACLSFRGYEAAWVAERSSTLARAFSGAIRKTTGRRPRLKYKTGTSDMNVVAPVWQCPILAYGPGDSSLDHTPWEHVELAEYLESIDVLCAALRYWVMVDRAERQKLSPQTGPTSKE